MPGGSTLLLFNTKIQSKLLQRNRNGKHGGYSHASWVNVIFGHGTETECLGAASDCPERLVREPGRGEATLHVLLSHMLSLFLSVIATGH